MIVHSSLNMDRDDSSLENESMLHQDESKSTNNRKKLFMILLIVIISIVLLVLIITLSVVLTRKKSKKVPETQVTFTGLNNVQLMQGKYFNCLSGVTAVTSDGKDLSSKIFVSGELNTAKEGDYILTYKLSDENFKKIEKQRKISVITNPSIGIKKPVPLYTLDNGQTYNIAKGCKVTTNSGKDNAGKAVDGDFSTRWESEIGVDNVIYTIDLGEILQFSQINIYWEAAFASNYELLASEDSETWNLLENVTNPIDLKFETISGQKVFPNRFNYDKNERVSVSARYVRIHCLKRITEYGYSIFEFEVIGQTGTVIPTEIYPDLFDAKNERSKD